VKVRALAVAIDATIAVDGRLDGGVADAMRDARRAGIMTVLVSGRLLTEVQAVLPRPDLFDAIVAEGGAVVLMPNGQGPSVLAPGPDAALVAELERRNVAYRSGVCMLETDAVSALHVVAVLQTLGSPHGISFDGGRLRVLPHGVSKASGLGEAVWRLGASLHNTVAIGAGEDDQTMLDACEIGAAVAWGSTVLQREADEVVPGSGPPAVAEYIRALLATETVPPGRIRHSVLRLRLGTAENGEPVDAESRERNALVAGDPRSGKTWFVGMLCEQIILRRYATCILDPEGDYACLEAFPGVVIHRAGEDEDTLKRLDGILRQPALSVVVDLSALATDAKHAAVRSLLRGVNALRRTLGVPHRVVLDEAHYFLHRPEDRDLFDPDLGGYLLATYRIADLAPGVLAACDAVIATRIADRRLATRLLELTSATETSADWVETLTGLAIGEAVLLPLSAEREHGITRFKVAPRMTKHVRHRRKYIDVGVPPSREFVFTREGRPTGHRVRTLRELLSVLPEISDEVFTGHLVRGDFHRWIEDVVGDRALGETIRSVELGDPGPARAGIARAIRARYLDDESEPCDERGESATAPSPGALTVRRRSA
jgi:hypothetical protein